MELCCRRGGQGEVPRRSSALVPANGHEITDEAASLYRVSAAVNAKDLRCLASSMHRWLSAAPASPRPHYGRAGAAPEQMRRQAQRINASVGTLHRRHMMAHEQPSCCLACAAASSASMAAEPFTRASSSSPPTTTVAATTVS